MVGTAQERLCPPYGLTEAESSVGWAKPPDANASGGVPTIDLPHSEMVMVGTAQERLCPPYGGAP
jgi:hypothetical protein